MSSARKRMELKDLAYSRLLQELRDLYEEICACVKDLVNTIECENTPDLVKIGALMWVLAIFIVDIPGFDERNAMKLLMQCIEVRKKDCSTLH